MISETELSGSTNIDALLGETQWSVQAQTSLTYSFPFETSSNASFYPHSGPNGEMNHAMTGLNATQRANVEKALGIWASLANLSFKKISESSTEVGELRFTFSWGAVSANSWGYSYYPGEEAGGDVWIKLINDGTHNSRTFDPGTYDFEATLHEIGHALGLDHPFEGIRLASDVENKLYTLMSYTEPDRYQYFSNDSTSGSFSVDIVNMTTPMIYDIAAIQYLYGANYDHNAGDDIYTFSPSDHAYRVIWDGGGTDEIDVSLFTENLWLDLREGQFSDLKIAVAPYRTEYRDFWDISPLEYLKTSFNGENALSIAYGVSIENLKSGSGDDHIITNSAANRVEAGEGNDVIEDAAGSDQYFGGAGIDTLVFAASADTYSIISDSYDSTSSESITARVETTENGPLETDYLTSIERLRFVDTSIALDIADSNSAGGIYRTYQAAFNRTPDKVGFGYWIDRVDSGASAVKMAEEFVWSQEFQDIYGVSTPYINNYLNGQNISSLVEGFYVNVLGRQPDLEGLNFYTQQVELERRTVGRVLAEIADSDENRDILLPVIQHGMEYDLWLG